MFKHFLILFSLIIPFIGFSQNIFDYEKEISNKDNYLFQEIEFQNELDHIKLSGTLIKPKSDFDKIIIIVPGSGKDTRYAHFVLAEKLLENGMAVYRFDERGVAKSEGGYTKLATDLSSDLNFAFKEIKEHFPHKRIGIIGHSLGGIATLRSIENYIQPNFVIHIETPIIKNGAFVLNQFKNNYEYSLSEVVRKGKSKDEVVHFFEGYIKVLNDNNNPKSLKKELKKYIKANNFNTKLIVFTQDDFFVEMVNTDLEEIIKNTSTPTLYLSGTKDEIINHREEIALINSFKNQNIEVHIFEGLNHWLTDRNGIIGSSLYQIDEEPLSLILDWLNKK